MNVLAVNPISIITMSSNAAAMSNTMTVNSMRIATELPALIVACICVVIAGGCVFAFFAVTEIVDFIDDRKHYIRMYNTIGSVVLKICGIVLFIFLFITSLGVAIWMCGLMNRLP